MLREELKPLFERSWPPWVGGVLMGVLVGFMFLYGKPWGVADGMWNWGDNLLRPFFKTSEDVSNVLFHSTSIINLSFLFGALVSALLAGEFKLSVPSGKEAARGVFGGILMGIGSFLGMGCTVGAFLTGFGALSGGGLVIMAGFLVGAYLGLRLYMATLSAQESGGRALTPSPRAQWGVGLLLFAAGVLTIALIQKKIVFSGLELGISTLIFFGLALGFINQRTRFCFVRAFREPFMTGEGEMTKAAALALMVAAVAGSLVKHAPELNMVRDQMAMVNPNFWLGSLAGGLIFGIGMVQAGGCSVGSMWRAGEGSIKSWIALLFFALSGSLTAYLFRKYELMSSLGTRLFLPEKLGWVWALVVLLGVAALWYLFAAWNERTEKFTIH